MNSGYDKIFDTNLGQKVFFSLTEDQKLELLLDTTVRRNTINQSALAAGDYLAVITDAAGTTATISLGDLVLGAGGMFAFATVDYGTPFFPPFLTVPGTIILGEDTPVFAKTVIDNFALSPATPVTTFPILVTNVPGGVTDPLTLGSASATFANVSFENLVGGGPGASAPLITAAGFRNFQDVTITATNFTRGSEVVAFTWSNP